MIIPDDYAQVNLFFTGSPLPNGAQMTFGIHNPTLSPANAATAVETAINGSSIRVLWMSSVTLSKVRVKNGPDQDGPFAERAVSFPGTSAAPDPAVPQVALLIRKQTALGGRRGGGRMYQPGVAETAVAHDGAVASGIITTANTNYTSFLTALSSASIPMMLLHDSSYTWAISSTGQPIRVKAPGVVPAPTTVTSLAIDPQCATQRRRNR